MPHVGNFDAIEVKLRPSKTAPGLRIADSSVQFIGDDRDAFLDQSLRWHCSFGNGAS